MGSKLDQRLALPRKALYAPATVDGKPATLSGPVRTPREVEDLRRVLQDRLPVETKEVVVAKETAVGETEADMKLRQIAFRVTDEERERIDRARGKVSMQNFLRAAALYMAEHVELLTEGT